MLDAEASLIVSLYRHGKYQKPSQACKHFLRENRRGFSIQATTHNSNPGSPNQLVRFGAYLLG